MLAHLGLFLNSETERGDDMALVVVASAVQKFFVGAVRKGGAP